MKNLITLTVLLMLASCVDVYAATIPILQPDPKGIAGYIQQCEGHDAIDLGLVATFEWDEATECKVWSYDEGHKRSEKPMIINDRTRPPTPFWILIGQ